MSAAVRKNDRTENFQNKDFSFKNSASSKNSVSRLATFNEAVLLFYVHLNKKKFSCLSRSKILCFQLILLLTKVRRLSAREPRDTR